MHSLTLAAVLLGGLSSASTLEKRFTSPSDPARFKFYDTPSKGVICDGDSGPDGDTLWYQDLVAPTVGVFNYKTEQFQEYPIPYSAAVPSTAPKLGNVTGLQCVMRLGKDGMMYAGSGVRNEIVVINPRTTPPHIQVFSPPFIPTANLQPFNDAWGGTTGMYYSQTTNDTVTKFDYLSHEFTIYPVPTPGNSPLGMRTDKDDNLWFTNFLGQFISKLNTKTGQVTEYKTCCPLPQSSFPEVLRSSTENQKYLWANAFGGNGFIRIDVSQDPPQFKTFTNPDGAGSFPFENSNDYCGRIWYTSPTLDNLYYYTPSTGQWTTVVVPSAPLVPNGGLPGSGNFEVIMHRGPGPYMWFSIGTLGKLVRYELDASCTGSPQ